jgi:hypothetical protein
MPKLILTKRGLRFETPLKCPTSYRAMLQRLGLLTDYSKLTLVKGIPVTTSTTLILP